MSAQAVVSRTAAEVREARFEYLRARIAVTDADDARTLAMLVIVHELLRREDAVEVDEQVVESGFDADRWPDAVAARLDVYGHVVARVRSEVSAVVPRGERVLVVSRGDDRLVDVPGVVAAHFPQDRGGGYAGHYPAEGAAALEHLEQLTAHGYAWLVLPASAFWWLDYYEELGLALRSRVAFADDDLAIYDLRRDGEERGART
jgi:hypothetical protein